MTPEREVTRNQAIVLALIALFAFAAILEVIL